MPYDSYQVERFMVLNGLTPGTRLEPGRWVKTVED
jgi:predicted Zn-dependent protease